MILQFKLANPTGHLVAVHQGHVAVDDHQIEMIGLPPFEAAAAIFGNAEAMSEKFQLLTHEQTVGRMVVDNQDM